MSLAIQQRVAASYFILQSVLGLVWLGSISVDLEMRSAFTPTGFPGEYLLSVRVPDLILFVGGSFATGISIWRKSRHAAILAACTFGAVAYATGLTVMSSVLTKSAYEAAVLMGLSLIGTSWTAFTVVRS